jgi:hypothetical protein
MSDNLSNFLVDLASDPDRMARFIANPMGEMDESPLTPAERQIIIAEDEDELQRALRPLKTNGSQAGGGGDAAVYKPKKKKSSKKTSATTKKKPAGKKK